MQINFAEIDDKTNLLPKSGLLQILHGSISQSEIKAIFRRSSKELVKTSIPDQLNYNGDTDYQCIQEKILIQTEVSDDSNIQLVSGDIIDKTNLYLEMTNNSELETNVINIKENEIEYFGQSSGSTTVDNLLESKENCFQLGRLTWEEWRNKLKDFDKNQTAHINRYKDLICLTSIPTNHDIGMVFGDSYRVETYIFKEDLKKEDFSNMRIKYAIN